MKPGQDLSDVTAGVITGMRDVFARETPDMVLVHGDTTTSFAAGLAAYYARIPVGHVEAGLRTGNIYAPWPEEMNRRLTGSLAQLHFAPTQTAKANLLREGVDAATIHVTGNTVIDALLAMHGRIRNDAQLRAGLDAHFDFLDPSRRIVLVTGHRRENFGDGFEQICHALRDLAARDDVEVVYPVHLNPNVREPVERLLSGHPRIHLIAPQEYVPFVYLMGRSTLILTDSGGVQEEAPSLGKPVLVMRETTERPEAVDAGAVALVGASRERIVAGCTRLLDDVAAYKSMAQVTNPYGDGTAADRIVQHLRK